MGCCGGNRRRRRTTPQPRPRQDEPFKKPSTIKKIWSFAGAIAKYVASGARNVTPEEYRERLKTCQSCDQLDDEGSVIAFNTFGPQCKACGCFLNIKAKIKREMCPLNKWPKLEEKENGNDND